MWITKKLLHFLLLYHFKVNKCSNKKITFKKFEIFIAVLSFLFESGFIVVFFFALESLNPLAALDLLISLNRALHRFWNCGAVKLKNVLYYDADYIILFLHTQRLFLCEVWVLLKLFLDNTFLGIISTTLHAWHVFWTICTRRNGPIFF